MFVTAIFDFRSLGMSEQGYDLINRWVLSLDKEVALERRLIPGDLSEFGCLRSRGNEFHCLGAQ